MPYELAKRLKDAGLPQGGEGDGMFPDGALLPYRPKDREIAGPEVCYVPTLSELIAACRDAFRTLHVTLLPSKRWHATAVNVPQTALSTKEVLHTVHGGNPEEAVARLWLALNAESPAAQKSL